MSYASVTAHNAPPESELPQPSQALLDGHFKGETELPAVPDVDSKLAVVSPDWKEHPETTTTLGDNVHTSTTIPHNPPVDDTNPHVSEVAPKPVTTAEAEAAFEAKSKEIADEVEEKLEKGKKVAGKKADALKAEGKDLYKKGKAEAKDLYKKGKEELEVAEGVLEKYFEKSKDAVLRPGVLGGLLGVVNVGILSTIGYFAYTKKDQPWDRRIVGGVVAGTLALFGGEGFLAEQYLETPEGQAEASRAKKEGSKLWLQTKETVLRPGVAGGLVGALNVAILGTVGYFSYQNWNRPAWDRRYVGGVAAGLLALSGVEGVVGKYYKDNELPKRK